MTQETISIINKLDFMKLDVSSQKRNSKGVGEVFASYISGIISKEHKN